MGILYGVCNLCCPGVNLIFFIMYWMKIANYKNQLMSSPGGGGDDDDYDDRPRRPRRDEDEDDRPRRPRRDDE